MSLAMEAAVVSSVFYGCVTWLVNNITQATSMYNKMIRCLLGVRENTSMKLFLIESGKQSAKLIINKRMRSFLTKKLQNRDMDEPFQIAHEIFKAVNLNGFKFLKKVIDGWNSVHSL